jgi:hypothetical protein
MRAFVAGASGAIGTRLVPRLIERGHEATATHRSPGHAERVGALGARHTSAVAVVGARPRSGSARARRWRRRSPSCTTSSASLTLLSIREAIANADGRSWSNSSAVIAQPSPCAKPCRQLG